MSVSQADYAVMEKLYEDERAKVRANEAAMSRLDKQIVRVESLIEQVLARVENLPVHNA